MTHDNHHDASETRTHRFSKLPDDGDHWALNNLPKSGAKEKHQSYDLRYNPWTIEKYGLNSILNAKVQLRLN